jgi:hypothetical protein
MPKAPKGKIIVFGILFFYPLAGVTYQFLHYLIGLRRLGYDPYYVEDSARWIYDPRLNDMAPDPTANIAMVLPALKAHGFADRWCFRGCYEGGGCHGLSETQLTRLYRDADAFLNVTGAQEIRDEHRAIQRRIYVESDPFASQVKVAQGDQGMIDLLAAHDTHFSFGENLGAPDCDVPLKNSAGCRPVSRSRWNLERRVPRRTDLHDHHHPAQQGQKSRMARRNVVLDEGPQFKHSHLPRLRQRAFEMPPAWRRCKNGCASRAGIRLARSRFRAMLSLPPTSSNRAVSSPWRAINTSARTPAGSATALAVTSLRAGQSSRRKPVSANSCRRAVCSASEPWKTSCALWTQSRAITQDTAAEREIAAEYFAAEKVVEA